MGVIDFPEPTLLPELWDCSTHPECRVRPEIRQQILDTLISYVIQQTSRADVENLIRGVFLTGSSATYQWTSTSDIDITVVLSPEVYDSWEYHSLLDGLSTLNGQLMVGEHPVNYFFTFYLAPVAYDAVYDLAHDVWVKKPKKIEPFDPRVKFVELWYRMTEWCEDVDETIGELRRNLIDWKQLNSLVHSAESLGPKYTQFLYGMIRTRINRINQEIRELVDKYNELHEERKLSYQRMIQSMTPEQVMSASWLPADIKYKFAERYKYNALMIALKKLLKQKGYIRSEEDLEKVVEILNEFLKVSAIPGGVRKDIESPNLFLRLVPLNKAKYPFKHRKKKPMFTVRPPQGFMITVEDMSGSVQDTLQQGFNTWYERHPLPNNTGPQKSQPWEDVEEILRRVSGRIVVAQEPEGGGVGPAATPTEEPAAVQDAGGESPVEDDLERLLSPSTEDLQTGLVGDKDYQESAENYFKTVKEQIPKAIENLSEYDRWLFYALEKKRIEAINNMDASLLKMIDTQIEKLIEKYYSPLPAPKPALDSTSIAASVLSREPDLQEAVEAVAQYLTSKGLYFKQLRLGYRGEGMVEIIADVWKNTESTHIAEVYYPHVPIVVVFDYRVGAVSPIAYTVGGQPIDLNDPDQVDMLIGGW